ncbi:MAG: arsenate reductase ArsC, partial [Planctomycetota bacterium]
MQRPRVLFLCTGNSCRSQMAEGWLRRLGGQHVEALSAGTRPKGIHPLAVRAMAEVGIDLGGQSSKSIDAFLAEPPDVVIAVCDH